MVTFGVLESIHSSSKKRKGEKNPLTRNTGRKTLCSLRIITEESGTLRRPQTQDLDVQRLQNTEVLLPEQQRTSSSPYGQARYSKVISNLQETL